MRLIVACQECKRQYDASGKTAGARFRCHCGAEVAVGQPRGKEASVVRCSSCGAPRESQSPYCAHCGADFTIHEQDLHTVCPNCMARVSDRARYCHHCATLLVAESVAGESTMCHCPACGPDRTLTSRKLGDRHINVLECQTCGGFWISLATFDKLLDVVASRMKPATTSGPPPIAEQRTPYRPCAVCGKLMTRRNFGRRSGVIVDVCGFHGIWFDTQELSQVVRWVRSGGLEAARLDLARLQNSRDLVRKRQAQQWKRPAETSSSPSAPGEIPVGMSFAPTEDPLADIAEAAIALVGGLFRRR
jgi:Zn-finger nucleic acid-binding protein/DNA-directed RNA polymerase subunit RPC12/RpoP